jgi:antitoxin YefM
MEVLTCTDARANLKRVMDRVVDDHREGVVTRKNGGSVVMVSLETWNAIRETTHLLSTPANARGLRGSIAQLDAGDGMDGSASAARDCAMPVSALT